MGICVLCHKIINIGWGNKAYSPFPKRHFSIFARNSWNVLILVSLNTSQKRDHIPVRCVPPTSVAISGEECTPPCPLRPSPPHSVHKHSSIHTHPCTHTPSVHTPHPYTPLTTTPSTHTPPPINTPPDTPTLRTEWHTPVKIVRGR